MDASNIHSADTREFDRFSPRKTILQIQGIGSYLLSKWKQILLFGILCAIGGTALIYFNKPSYMAEITFTLDEGVSQSNGGGMTEISSQLGLSAPSSAGGFFTSMSNITELMQSRLLIEKTIRRQVVINNKKIVLADFFLDSLNYRKKWMKNSPYYHMSFLSVPKTAQEDLYRNTITKMMHSVLTSKCLKIDTKGKGTTIFSITCTSEHELFSKYFLEALIDEVSQFYIETKTKRAKNYLNFIQQRTDSTRMAYNQSLYGRASFIDANVNPSLRIASVSGEKQQTQVQLLSSAYIELVRNMEAAKTTLMRETPLIQLLDTPVLPLKKSNSNIPFIFILSGIAGVFVSIFYFISRKVLHFLMKY